MTYDLRLGDYKTVLADVECDALITDPPYSARTHNGQCTEGRDGSARRDLSYSQWTADDAAAFVREWAPRTRGWMVCVSDSELCSAYRAAFESCGLTAFQPIPCLIRGMTVRLSGDGPSSWAVYLNVARPKALARWGTLDGGYESGPGERFHVGGKPLALMRRIVADYSRPGDIVCDPCAGGGTTLLAALCEKRRAIGAELDPVTHAKADARLRAWCEMPLFDTAPEQQELLP